VRSVGVAWVACGCAFAACGARHEPSAPLTLAGAPEPGPAAKRAPEPPPPVVFATRTSEEVAVYRLGADHVEVLGRAPRLGTRDLEDLAWVGPALYVQLDDGGVAAVRGDALVPIVMPPDGAWHSTHDADEVKLFPDRTLVASGGELWQGRCEWGHSDGETSSCDEWAWARIAPAPAIAQAAAPPQTPDRELPTADAPTRMTMDVVLEQTIDAAPGDVPRPRHIVRCTIDGATTEYPALDARDGFEGMGDSVRWLWADPPLATVDVLEPAYDGTDHVPVVFEGCTARARGAIVVGPDDVLGVKDDGTLRLWWHGRLVGSVPADAFAFGPSR
jgi:hypothetical protein